MPRFFREDGTMRYGKLLFVGAVSAILAGVVVLNARAQEQRPSSYSPVVIREDFQQTVARMEAAKPQLAERQNALLEMRTI